MTDKSPFIVDADWLQERLGKPGLSIVDGSWYLPAHQRDPRAEYDAGHIPGAVFFDHDLISHPDSDLPHTLPEPEAFARHVGSMGIAETDTIVVYDGPGYLSAPRVWWMLRVMGAKEVYLLDGGLDGWKAEGRPLTEEPSKIAPCLFNATFDRQRVADLAEMRKIVDSGERQIADARSGARFSAKEPEPRRGLRSGHMPGARSVPSASLSRDGKLLPLNELRQKLESAGLDLSKPVVTSCGSGITAAVISLALESLGHSDHKLYDGSWTEWAALPDTPVVTGEE